MHRQTVFSAAPIEERLDRHSIPEPMSGCVLWTGAISETGYGKVWFQNRLQRAHRVSWIVANGPVPEGLVIDHKCRVRSCINPAHLRAITFRENVLCGEGVSAQEARRTACPRGHAYDIVKRDGRRGCRTCKNLLRRKSFREERAA